MFPYIKLPSFYLCGYLKELLETKLQKKDNYLLFLMRKNFRTPKIIFKLFIVLTNKLKNHPIYQLS